MADSAEKSTVEETGDQLDADLELETTDTDDVVGGMHPENF